MIAVLDSMMFAAAFAASVSVFAFTLLPAAPRIAALLRGETDFETMHDAFIVVSERRLQARTRLIKRVPGQQVSSAATREAA